VNSRTICVAVRVFAAVTTTLGGGPIGAGVQLNTTGAEGGFATHICDVEVDPELGTVKVLRYTSFQDVGRAVHPALHAWAPDLLVGRVII
jgi:CO/xanthine dehydrogenase Mo-binding subunit